MLSELMLQGMRVKGEPPSGELWVADTHNPRKGGSRERNDGEESDEGIGGAGAGLDPFQGEESLWRVGRVDRERGSDGLGGACARLGSAGPSSRPGGR